MHDEIRNKHEGKYDEIYNSIKARNLYKTGENGSRNLSIMKQENIKEAIERGYDISAIKVVIPNQCGLCFAYNRFDYLTYACEECPIFKQLGEECYNLSEYKDMENATTHAELKDAHRKWCDKIGFKEVYGSKDVLIESLELSIDKKGDTGVPIVSPVRLKKYVHEGRTTWRTVGENSDYVIAELEGNNLKILYGWLKESVGDTKITLLKSIQKQLHIVLNTSEIEDKKDDEWRT